MIFVLLGIVIGALVASGYIPFLAHGVDAATVAAVNFGQQLATSGVHQISPSHPSLVAALGTTLGVAVPGLVCLALIGAAKLGLVLRRGAGALLTIGGIAAFFFLPTSQALVVAGLSAVIGSLMLFTTGAFIVAPLCAVASALAVSSGRVLLAGKNAAVTSGVATLQQIAHVSDPQIWRIALVVVAWAGFVGAALVALHPIKS